MTYLSSVFEFKSRSGEVYSIQHYVITFVSDLRQVGGFRRVLRFLLPIKLTVTIQTLLDNAVLSTHRHERDSNSQHNWCTGTDCTGSCKSNYHTITTTSLFIEHVGHKLFTNLLHVTDSYPFLNRQCFKCSCVKH
jgi:hypothetical protein